MCYGLGDLANFIIVIIIVCGVCALLRLLINFLMPRAPQPMQAALSFLVQALYIILWVVVAIAVVLLIFNLIGCLWTGTLFRVR